jgi:hypothetical protein
MREGEEERERERERGKGGTEGRKVRGKKNQTDRQAGTQ